ncbi:undecaprenyl-phosphate glucose phosphotransferase [Xenophilus sp.]|uniref:undecaprenyl-phosphate glucose phosphotransferase n=1 Tax=Xenophilus sp. TaxID=1873499 RepID=UPI0037DCE1FB
MLFASVNDGTKAPILAAGSMNAMLGLALRVGDVVIFGAAGILAFALRFGHVSVEADYAQVISHGVLLAMIVLNGGSVYRSWRGHSVASEAMQLAAMWMIIFCLLAVYVLAFKVGHDLSRLWWFGWFVLGLGGAVVFRAVVRGAANWVRAQGMDARSAVVVGANPDAQRLVDVLRRNKWAGIEVCGWFATDADRSQLTGAPLLGSLERLGEYVESHQIAQVWLAMPLQEQAQIAAAVSQLRHCTADIRLVPDLFGIHLLNHSVEEVAGLPVITLQQTPLQGVSRIVKAVEDRLLAFLILLLISPLMLLIAAAVKLSSPGPVFYRQERVSWNNQRFQMLKFRSMPVDAEQRSGAVWAKAGEQRATRVGAFLRRTSLDELPQFINVLMGDMSIVGPRPERPVFVEKFKNEIPAYMKKHMVKAGITGWAQINGWRGSTDLAKRIECDIFYIQHWSLGFDLWIIFLTLFKGFVHKNAY